MSISIVKRRRILLASGATALAGGAALLMNATGMFAAYPHGAPLRVDLNGLTTGRLQTIEWQGLPVWLLRRSPADIAALESNDPRLTDPRSEQSLQPPSCRNRQRSVRPDIFVAIGLCTHQGCTPALLGNSGFLCPCHASRYDLAGRVFKVGPANANLVIPAYRFETEDKLMLGVDS
jgi:ubiquinol-cytochrome c reductase iron-sulfur subunit